MPVSIVRRTTKTMTVSCISNSTWVIVDKGMRLLHTITYVQPLNIADRMNRKKIKIESNRSTRNTNSIAQPNRMWNILLLQNGVCDSIFDSNKNVVYCGLQPTNNCVLRFYTKSPPPKTNNQFEIEIGNEFKSFVVEVVVVFASASVCTCSLCLNWKWFI